MAKLAAGDRAPDFDLTDADSQPVQLSDFSGSRVILYFYPAALTPGCTLEAIDFGAALDQISAAGYRVVGVSPDPAAKLARFRDEHDLRFCLLSDPDRSALEAYGAYGTKLLYGKQVAGVIRSTFVIDVDQSGTGTISAAFYNVRATGHVQRVLRELGLS